MTMNKVFRLNSPHKPEKNLKTPVTWVFFIVNSQRGGVCQEYVKPAAPKNPVNKQPGDEFEYLPAHPEIGKLVFAPVIAHRAAEPGNYQPPFAFDFGPYMSGPAAQDKVTFSEEGGIFTFWVIIMKMLQIMVAEYKKKRFIKAGNNEIQVIQGEVPGAEYEIDVAKTVFY
jgi:hypothetical protein